MERIQFLDYLIFRTSQGEDFVFCLFLFFLFGFVFSVTFGVRMVRLSSPSSQTEQLERKFSFQLQYTVGSSTAHSPQNVLFERF